MYPIKTQTRCHDIGHAQLVHIQLFLAGGEVQKSAVAAYLPEERKRGSRSTIYLVGVTERLTVAFHLFIGAPTQEAPLLEAEC